MFETLCSGTLVVKGPRATATNPPKMNPERPWDSFMVLGQADPIGRIASTTSDFVASAVPEAGNPKGALGT
jgi:hypothetical protein